MGSPLEEKLAEAITHAVIVRPGEHLVVAVGRRISMEEMYRCRCLLSGALPGVEVVIVEAVSLAVIRPDGGTDD